MGAKIQKKINSTKNFGKIVQKYEKFYKKLRRSCQNRQDRRILCQTNVSTSLLPTIVSASLPVHKW